MADYSKPENRHEDKSKAGSIQKKAFPMQRPSIAEQMAAHNKRFTREAQVQASRDAINPQLHAQRIMGSAYRGAAPAVQAKLEINEPALQHEATESQALEGASEGHKLPTSLQAKMESGFGTDFSSVNIHKNSSSAADMGALAYTQGEDIHFAPGQFDDSSHKGKSLIGHELTHVVQQRAGRVQPTVQAKGLAVNDDQGLEREADEMGQKVAQTPPNVAWVPPSTPPAQLPTSRSMPHALQMSLNKSDMKTLAIEAHVALAEGDHQGLYVVLQKLKRSRSKIKRFKATYLELFQAEFDAHLRANLEGSALSLGLELMNMLDPAETPNVPKMPRSDDEWDELLGRLSAAFMVCPCDSETIFANLIPFNGNPNAITNLTTKYKAKTGFDLDKDLIGNLEGSTLSYALFLLNSPKSASGTGEAMITQKGTEQAHGEVIGGNVSVRTGAAINGENFDDAFTMTYRGGQAKETRWLQFIWREMHSIDENCVETPIGGKIETTGGRYDLTTDPASPNFNTDSAHPTQPFYEASGADSRSRNKTTMADQPTGGDGKISKEFTKGAIEIRSRAHFETFLVRNFRPIFHVSITVEWVYISPTEPPRVQTVEFAGPCNSLPPRIKAALASGKYQKFSYIE